ncbi:unannotated protein [freshwater metagenome]|uniref:Unannotated protein n=1 Tax=freshwater metagenome TaxID=449393 RepID=A0A6J7FFK2_9ZZZZ|nr:SRPBCC family protein [Actinomycetota bacterium]
MKLHTIDIEVPCSASPEITFDILQHAAGWSTWSAAKKAWLEVEGSPTPDGVGAVRRFGTGPFMSREEVVAHEAPTHFAYVLHAGIPVKDYRADVRIIPVGSGCTISWRSTFHRKYPLSGTPTRLFLKYFLRDTARRLARAAQHRAAEAPAPPTA